jgi:hypothetical protein
VESVNPVKCNVIGSARYYRSDEEFSIIQEPFVVFTKTICPIYKERNFLCLSQNLSLAIIDQNVKCLQYSLMVHVSMVTDRYLSNQITHHFSRTYVLFFSVRTRVMCHPCGTEGTTVPIVYSGQKKFLPQDNHITALLIYFHIPLRK